MKTTVSRSGSRCSCAIRAHQAPEIDRFGFGLVLTRAGVVEQVFQQAVQPRDALLQHAKVGTALGAEAVVLVFHHPGAEFLHRAQRRAQVVGGDIGKFLQLDVRAPELLRVAPEHHQRAGHFAQLVAPSDGNRVIELALRDGVHCPRQTLDAAVELPFDDQPVGEDNDDERGADRADDHGDHLLYRVAEPQGGILDQIECVPREVRGHF